MDLGIQVNDKTGESRAVFEMEDMIDKINDVIADYGFRVRMYADWEIFKKTCVDEYDFTEELFNRLEL